MKNTRTQDELTHTPCIPWWLSGRQKYLCTHSPAFVFGWVNVAENHNFTKIQTKTATALQEHSLCPRSLKRNRHREPSCTLRCRNTSTKSSVSFLVPTRLLPSKPLPINSTPAPCAIYAEHPNPFNPCPHWHEGQMVTSLDSTPRAPHCTTWI